MTESNSEHKYASQSWKKRAKWLMKNRNWRFPAGFRNCFVSEDIDPAHLGYDVSLMNTFVLGGRLGSRLKLINTTISGDSVIENEAKLGAHGPVMVNDSVIGSHATIASGSVEKSVVANRASLGFGSSIRKNCVIDSEASVGQHNDLKNTYLGYATLVGSSTNFCDIAVCGGKPGSPVTQTEIGSGAIHFNFGIHGMKWGSWIGSISSLALTCKRSFIGGNTSLIGPVLIGDGVITMVGSQVRREIASSGAAGQKLVFQRGPTQDLELEFKAGRFGAIGPKLQTTLMLISRYKVLIEWFRHFRVQLDLSPVVTGRAITAFERVVAERIDWFQQIVAGLPNSIKLNKEDPSRQRYAIAQEKLLANLDLEHLEENYWHRKLGAELKSRAATLSEKWVAKTPSNVETLADAMGSCPDPEALDRWFQDALRFFSPTSMAFE